MAGADHRSWPGDNARCGIGAFVSRCRVTWERFQPTGVFGTLTWLSPLSTPRFSPSYCPISSLLAFESLLLSYFTPYSPSFIASLFLLFYSSPLCPSLFSLCFSSSYLPPPAPGRKMPEAEGDISSLWRYLAQLWRTRRTHGLPLVYCVVCRYLGLWQAVLGFLVHTWMKVGSLSLIGVSRPTSLHTGVSWLTLSNACVSWLIKLAYIDLITHSFTLGCSFMRFELIHSLVRTISKENPYDVIFLWSSQRKWKAVRVVHVWRGRTAAADSSLPAIQRPVAT